jgi:hypothetical protein
MPSKKQNKKTLRFTQENSERRAFITIGIKVAEEAEKTGKDDAGKPLYLKRI